MSLTVPLYGFGGGGESLNFKVVGDTTEPTNPNKNTIWVNTDKKIASWIFSATQPKTATEGMVWIFTSTFSAVEFNALKKNGIQVYPIFAKQYVSGAWVDKTAKSYQNGVWVDWIVRIYELGWVAPASKLIQIASNVNGNTSSDDKKNIDVSYSSGYIVFNRTKWNGMACVYVDIEYNLNGVNTVYCRTGSIGSGSGFDGGAIYFGVGEPGSVRTIAKIKLAESNKEYKLSLPSSLPEKCVIGFYGPEEMPSDWIWNNRQIEAIWY